MSSELVKSQSCQDLYKRNARNGPIVCRKRPPLKMHLFSRQRDMGVADPSGKINGQKDIFLKAMMGIGQMLRMNPSLDST